MNQQPIEKKIIFKTGQPSKEDLLDVADIFLTIQGEGPFTGRRAIFIRLAGCNLQCPACDTDYTSDREDLTIDNIVDRVIALTPLSLVPGLVVITGGEPFRQNISLLSNWLIELGYTVQIETNGTLAPSPGLSESVVIVCSPKTGKMNPEIRERADCFKYVMHSESVSHIDGLPLLALDHTAKPEVARPPNNGKPVYLQPMDSLDIQQNYKNQEAVLLSCMGYGHILQLQLHKIIGVD